MARITAAAAAFSELIIEVFRLNGLALAAGDRLTAPAGLTSARWQVLGVIDHGPATVAQIARTMGLTRQSVQQTADALASDGHLAYVDNPHHRRAKLAALTPAGREALREVEVVHASWAHRLGKRVDLATLRATVEALRQARQLLEDEASRPRPSARRKD